MKSKKNNFKKYTDDIIKYIKKNSDCSRSEIKTYLSKQYGWLENNNKEWLNNNLPKPKKRESYVKKYNLEEKDEYILKKIKIVYEDIINEKTPIRISIRAIEKRIKMRINSKIDKLPKCKAYLSEVLDSVHKFRVRRLKTYLNNEETVKNNKTRSQILRATSSLVGKLTKEEKEEMEEIIIEYINNFINVT